MGAGHGHGGDLVRGLEHRSACLQSLPEISAIVLRTNRTFVGYLAARSATLHGMHKIRH
jgi:hypothetical protein